MPKAPPEFVEWCRSYFTASNPDEADAIYVKAIEAGGLWNMAANSIRLQSDNAVILGRVKELEKALGAYSSHYRHVYEGCSCLYRYGILCQSCRVYENAKTMLAKEGK